MLKNIEFNDITKAHALVVTEAPEMAFDDILFEVETTVPINSSIVSVRPHEIGEFARELNLELNHRKSIIMSYGVVRKSDIEVTDIFDNEVLNDVYVCMLLPRTLMNKNISMLSNIYSQTIRFGIHIITVIDEGADERILEEIDKYSYWKINWDYKEVMHK